MSDVHSRGLSARESIRKLMEGNFAFAEGHTLKGDYSPTVRHRPAAHEQTPYAVIITTSRQVASSSCSAGASRRATVA